MSNSLEGNQFDHMTGMALKRSHDFLDHMTGMSNLLEGSRRFHRMKSILDHMTGMSNLLEGSRRF